MLKHYFYSNITFLENPFSFSVALKTSLEPLRTIFPWCPLGLHLGSGQCPFNQEKCLRRCGIEDKNGLAIAHPNPPPPPSTKPGLTQQLYILGIMVWREVLVTWRCVALFRVEDGLGEPKANRSFLFYSSIIKPVITPILDLLFLEKSNTSIRTVISIKILFHYRLGYWTCFI